LSDATVFTRFDDPQEAIEAVGNPPNGTWDAHGFAVLTVETAIDDLLRRLAKPIRRPPPAAIGDFVFGRYTYCQYCQAISTRRVPP
jgi:hypothetical protein